MTDTPGRQRTAPARAARRLNAQKRRAAELRVDGWICIPPDVPRPQCPICENAPLAA